MDEKRCPECGKRVIGRIDKKFCSPECKTSFNNYRNRSDNSLMLRINRILKRNRDILLLYKNGNGQVTIPKSQLLLEGFNFNYITHQVDDDNGKLLKCCYDFGYEEQEPGKLVLKRFS